MPEPQSITNTILAKIRRFVLLSGHDALTSALTGDMPTGPLASGILELRNSLEKYLTSQGYWRANLHLGIRAPVLQNFPSPTKCETPYLSLQAGEKSFPIRIWGDPRTFHPWRPVLTPTAQHSGLRLPFLDIRNGRFRPFESRALIEDSSGWYSAIGQANPNIPKPTSWFALNWLDWKNNKSPQKEDDFILLIRPGEIYFLLMLLAPQLLPLSENPFIQQEKLSEDGRVALDCSTGVSDSAGALAFQVVQWLKGYDEVDRPFSCSFRIELLKRLGRTIVQKLIAALQIFKESNVADLIAMLESEPTFNSAREKILTHASDFPYLRFRLDEPIKSGTRSILLWPVSGGPSWAAGETEGQSSDIFCVIALQPLEQDLAKKGRELVEFIERLLLHALPAAMVLEIQGHRSIKAFESAHHQIRNLASVARARLESLQGWEAISTIALLRTFEISVNAWLAFSERAKDNAAKPSPRDWLGEKGPNFGELLTLAFTQPKRDSSGFQLSVKDGLLRGTAPDIRVFGLCWELVRNAHKHRVLNKEDDDWQEREAYGSAVLEFSEGSGMVCMECISGPHDRARALGIYSKPTPVGGRILSGIDFIQALCSDLGSPIAKADDAWTLQSYPNGPNGWVLVKFSCSFDKSRFYPKGGNS